MPKKYDLIGGQSHGDSVEVADISDSFDSPVYADEDKLSESSHSETYTRRHFEGEEFGASFECFGLDTDDDTETQELARVFIHEGTDHSLSITAP